MSEISNVHIFCVADGSNPNQGYIGDEPSYIELFQATAADLLASGTAQGIVLPLPESAPTTWIIRFTPAYAMSFTLPKPNHEMLASQNLEEVRTALGGLARLISLLNRSNVALAIPILSPPPQATKP